MAERPSRRIVKELWQSGPGKAGLILLALLAVTSLVVIVSYPRNFGTGYWANPGYWADNPKSAPPAWTNALTREKRPRHLVIDIDEPAVSESTGRAFRRVYSEKSVFDADFPPTFVSFSVSNLQYSRRPPVLTVFLIRPDGGEVTLARRVASGPRQGEEVPYVRYADEPLRESVGADDRVLDSLSRIHGVDRQSMSASLEAALFGISTDEGGFGMLRGEYTLQLEALFQDEDDSLGSVRFVLGGSVYGVMGTDALGRDLALGLLYGLPVALLIGVATSTVSTLLGMFLGMTSGYSGGWIDLSIQRAADIVANIPVLPLLIFLVFIGGSKLWLILLVLVAFSWPGLTIMVRTMVLQLKTGLEVESAKALGASSFRIVFRHILPHAASYVLAQLVFFAPSAILAEAGLSFLGLGDPSIPTWGQILEYGFRTGAVFLGYWWWVVPPGLFIVLTAVTFMFLALGLEPVVDPRLRGRRSWHF
ncbi:MAG: ABC transporter permease [Spirochaetales bacterium]|nr:ABC transporter permease [Spirochaetales bacterium]